jgi:hypothetical protein
MKSDMQKSCIFNGFARRISLTAAAVFGERFARAGGILFSWRKTLREFGRQFSSSAGA